MSRRSRHAVLMDAAHVFATRGTCSRAQVGAVIARDGRIIVTGYNGAPAGLAHCDHTCDCDQHPTLLTEPELVPWDHHRDCVSQRPCETATHAEANIIAFAARHGVATEDADLYVTMAPCLPCARLIINAGLMTVYYDAPYRDMSGVQLLVDTHIQVQRGAEI